jgi:hypothetical protein
MAKLYKQGTVMFILVQIRELMDVLRFRKFLKMVLKMFPDVVNDGLLLGEEI